MWEKRHTPRTNQVIVATAISGQTEKAVASAAKTAITCLVCQKQFQVNVMAVLMVEISPVSVGVLRRFCRSLASGDMTEKDFQKYDRTMRRTPGFRSNKRVSPRKCCECEYYRPDWRYRSCYFIKCSYHIRESTFREVPLLVNPFPAQEVVNMNGI